VLIPACYVNFTQRREVNVYSPDYKAGARFNIICSGIEANIDL
jgi:hypothetical protein